MLLYSNKPIASDMPKLTTGRDAFGRTGRPRTLTKVRWPSGLRRQLKALVRKGVGSNPTLIILFP